MALSKKWLVAGGFGAAAAVAGGLYMTQPKGLSAEEAQAQVTKCLENVYADAARATQSVKELPANGNASAIDYLQNRDVREIGVNTATATQRCIQLSQNNGTFKVFGYQF